MVIKVYRCRTCQAVYDYHPTRHPKVLLRPVWVRKSQHWGRMEAERVIGCPTCGHAGEMRIGTLTD